MNILRSLIVIILFNFFQFGFAIEEILNQDEAEEVLTEESEEQDEENAEEDNKKD